VDRPTISSDIPDISQQVRLCLIFERFFSPIFKASLNRLCRNFWVYFLALKDGNIRKRLQRGKPLSRLFEFSSLLMRFNQIAAFIEDANDNIRGTTITSRITDRVADGSRPPRTKVCRMAKRQRSDRHHDDLCVVESRKYAQLPLLKTITLFPPRQQRIQCAGLAKRLARLWRIWCKYLHGKFASVCFKR